jgi:hypothetical protein
VKERGNAKDKAGRDIEGRHKHAYKHLILSGAFRVWSYLIRYRLGAGWNISVSRFEAKTDCV